MQIGTILTFAGDDSEGSIYRSGDEAGGAVSPLASRDILGASLIERTVARLRTIETLPPVILRENSDSAQFLPARSQFAHCIPSEWDDVVGRYIRDGVGTLCLIRVNQYTDIDYAELLRFHLQTHSRVTQVYDFDGPLDIALVDTASLSASNGGYRKSLGKMMAEQRRFHYRGYVNRQNTTADFHRLAHDGLFGRCGLSPAGTQVQEGVWVAERAQIDSTARLLAPAFVGAGSRIRAGCTIVDSSIERNCQIDCGSLVERSWVLQDTYVGVGLDVCHSVVSGRKLFHLDRNIEISLADPRLMGVNVPPSPWLSIMRRYAWRTH